MKNLYIAVGFIFLSLSGYSQLYHVCYNYNYLPKIDATSNGIWKGWERTIETDSVQYGSPDSLYFDVAGFPDFGDLNTFDMEVKVKSLWYKDSLFFLFQRLDDTYVNGLDEEGQPDNTVAEGLDNLDATKIYFYLSSDSLRIDSNFIEDSLITWIQFVWKSDKVAAKLSSGEIVDSYEEFHTNQIQWCDDIYCYAKLGIDIGQLAPNKVMDTVRIKMNTYGVGGIGFFLETTDNDKEVQNDDDLYIIQTRAFWGSLIDSGAINNADKWNWLAFVQDSSNYYINPIYSVQEPFASVYPVPTYSLVHIQLEEYDEIDYIVYDIMGRRLLSGSFQGNNHAISLEQFASGPYIIQMRNKNGEFMSVKTLKLDP